MLINQLNKQFILLPVGSGLGYPTSLGQSVLSGNGKWESNNLDASGTAKAQTK